VLAREWEKSILKHLRTHGAIMAPDAGLQKFDGYTEAWLRSSFPVNSLNELRSLVDDEEWPFDESALLTAGGYKIGTRQTSIVQERQYF
jgi:hypothetical protein